LTSRIFKFIKAEFVAVRLALLERTEMQLKSDVRCLESNYDLTKFSLLWERLEFKRKQLGNISYRLQEFKEKTDEGNWRAR
jgi:uncharacterized protein YydD (DUF2326 family)